MKKSIIKGLLLTAIMLVGGQVQLSASGLLSQQMIVGAAATDVVTIGDQQLEECLIEETDILDADDITVENLSLIDDLACSGYGISDITELSYLTNVESLDLDDNEITDISALSGLSNIEYLYLENNQISDISPLSNMTYLSELYLSSNQVSDISPLSELTTLTSITMFDNQVSDLSPLSELTDLWYLVMDKNQIVDISPLSNLTNLFFLTLNNNQISDLSPLSGLNELNSLFLYDNKIVDVSPLGNLPKLTNLYLSENQISDLSGLSTLPKIETLVLSDNLISDLSPLTSLTTLNTLRLSINQISDLSPISALTNINLNTNLSVRAQSLNPDAITVTTNDDIIYEVTNIDGSKQQINLGKPVPGINLLSKDWYFKVGSSQAEYTGTVTQQVTYIEQITGNATASTNQGTALDSAALIELFEVIEVNGNPIEVLSDEVNFDVPGDYVVTFTSQGNVLTAILTVTDVLPQIEVDKNVVTITAGDSLENILSQLALSATEITSGDLTSSIVYDDSNIDYNTPGEYTLSVLVSDAEGNSDSVEITVTIEAGVSPITVEETVTITEHTVINEANLLTLFNAESSKGQNITVDFSAVNIETPGEYAVVFTDEVGNSLTSTLVVTDVMPTLEVIETSVSIEAGETLAEVLAKLTYTATEITLGDLNESIVFDDAAIDYSLAGIYTLVVSVSDTEGNVDSVEVTVMIDEASLPLTANTSATITEHSAISEASLLVLFNAESSKNQNITVDFSAVNIETPGEYSVVFTDEAGNTLTSTLIVTDVMPTLEVLETEVTIEFGDTFQNILAKLTYTATEITVGDLNANVEFDGSEIDYHQAGVYSLVVYVTDAEGNTVQILINVIINEEVIEESEVDSEVESEVDSEVESEVDSEVESEVDSEVNSEVVEESEAQEVLQETGSVMTITTIIMTFSLIVLVSLKRVINQ